MARFFNGTVLTALVAGFAGGVMASLVLPNASRSIRPAAKSAIKAGLTLMRQDANGSPNWARRQAT